MDIKSSGKSPEQKAHALELFILRLALPSEEHNRLKLLVNNLKNVNWVDALGNSQIVSKLRLAQILKELSHADSRLVMVGGWIGLIQYFLDLEQVKYHSNLNLELDPEAIKASLILNEKAVMKNQFQALHVDAMTFDYFNLGSPLIVINTSCEHLSHYDQWIKLIPDGALCILQSNNMFGLEEHVNCHKSLKEFMDSCGLKEIHFSEEIDIGNDWHRFMIVGKR